MPKSSKLKTNKNQIKLRLASLKDSKFLLNLHNFNVEKKNFFSKKKVSTKDHFKWLNEKIKSKMLFVCILRYRIGYIRYDQVNKNHLSVSIAIKENYKGKGFGRLMLSNSLKKKYINRFCILAFVKKDNLASKKFFLSNNFIKEKKNKYSLKV